jgi:hypothetical protein
MEFREVSQISDIPADRFDALDPAAGGSGSHARLRQRESDGRWEARYLCCWEDGRLLAAVPLYRPRFGAWPDPWYDPAAWRLPGPQSAACTPRRSLVVGGCSGLRSTLHVDPDLRSSERFAEVLARIARIAAEQDRGLVVPYLYPESAEALVRAGGGRIEPGVIARDGVLRGFDRPDWEAGVGWRVRKHLNEDRRLIAAVQPAVSFLPWSQVEDRACKMIAEHAGSKDRPDHPELVRMRYREWAECEGARCLAITGESANVTGVVAAVVWRDELDLIEIGLDGFQGRERLAVYVDLVFHAPMAYAREHGLRVIRLGVEATLAKSLRGVEIVDLYGAVLPPEATRELAGAGAPAAGK